MNGNTITQIAKLPLPCIGTALICAAYFTPNIQPVSISALLYSAGVAILAASGVHISGILPQQGADGK